jgi:hypothetical protein
LVHDGSLRISVARAGASALSRGRSPRKWGFLDRQSLSLRRRWKRRMNSEHAALGTAAKSRRCRSST